jgi:hypothetical protein
VAFVDVDRENVPVKPVAFDAKLYVALTCPHPLSTLNNEKTKLNMSNAEVKNRGLRDEEVVVARCEIELDDNAACAERRIVVIFIVSGLKYSFGSPNLEIKTLKIKDNEHLLVEKKQEGRFIDYSHINNDYLMRVIEYWGIVN